MGLNICRSIIQIPQGSLLGRGQPGRRHRLCLYLPSQGGAPCKHHAPTVFLVDDDDAIRDALSWLLQSRDLELPQLPSAEASSHNGTANLLVACCSTSAWAG